MRTQGEQVASLLQAIAEVTQQVRDLAHQVSELATLVRVVDVQRGELERRIGELEMGVADTRRRAQGNRDQWREGVGVALVAWALGLLSAMLVHMVWR